MGKKRRKAEQAPADAAPEPVELIDELQPATPRKAKSQGVNTTRGHEERVGQALITSR
jgi:hypothetical protein